METDHFKAFIISGAFCCIGTIISSGGATRFFGSRHEGKHPFQAATAAFVLGGIGGMLAYPLLKALGGEWILWK